MFRSRQQMKECADELDMGCQYHMARYAYLFETTLLADGSAILPVTEETGKPKPLVQQKRYVLNSSGQAKKQA